MNNIDLLVSQISVLGIVKWLVVFGLIVYGFFAFLIMRQVRVMNEALRVKKEVVVYIAGVAHFVMALLVLFLALTVL